MSDFELPGAPEFSRYLQMVVSGELTVQGPEVVDRSYNSDFGKKWIVKVDERQIGEYSTFGPKPGATDYTRFYRGYVPGNNAPAVKRKKSAKTSPNQLPHNIISLLFGALNQDAKTDLSDLVWQRLDGHKYIPFP